MENNDMPFSADDEYIAEVLSIFSSQTGKDINDIVAETLMEKAICLGPYIYAVEILRMMRLADAAIERLKGLGVDTNLDALINLNNNYRVALSKAAPWIFKGGLPGIESEAETKTISEQIDELIKRIERGDHK